MQGCLHDFLSFFFLQIFFELNKFCNIIDGEMSLLLPFEAFGMQPWGKWCRSHYYWGEMSPPESSSLLLSEGIKYCLLMILMMYPGRLFSWIFVALETTWCSMGSLRYFFFFNIWNRALPLWALTLAFVVSDCETFSTTCTFLATCASLVMWRWVGVIFLEFWGSLRWTTKGFWEYFDAHDFKGATLLIGLAAIEVTWIPGAAGVNIWNTNTWGTMVSALVRGPFLTLSVLAFLDQHLV